MSTVFDFSPLFSSLIDPVEAVAPRPASKPRRAA